MRIREGVIKKVVDGDTVKVITLEGSRLKSVCFIRRRRPHQPGRKGDRTAQTE